MKKFLSLVLALVMTMSLVTMAGAKDFTDAADVDYAEAVEVLTATGVVSGYTDGSVRPDVALNRGQAAKIICNLILGPTAASALPTSVAPYADVPAGSTFAGYIAYLAKEGLVSGYADGTFQPTAPLTGYAFMKMLLGVIGYDAAIEGYTGSNWAVSVAKQALAVGLQKGLEGDFVGTKTVTRQEAMLYAFNALKAEYVEYSTKGTNITIGGVVVSTGASEAVKNNDNSGAAYKYYEKLFDGDLDIVVAKDHDAYGRPATTWEWKNEEIGTFADKADYVITADTKLYTIGKALGYKEATDFYVGSTTSQKTINYYASTSTLKLSENVDDMSTVVGNGVAIEFFYDKDNASYNTIVVIDETFDEVTDVDSDDEGAYIVINNDTTNLKLYTDEKFAEEDKVVYTVGEDSKIVSAKKVEKLTGTLTKLTGAVATIGGVDYKGHKGQDLTALTVGTEYDFYLDSYGYIIDIATSSKAASVDNLVLFTDVNIDAVWGSKAKAIYASGKTATVDLKNAADDHVFYTFTTVDGKIKTSSNADYLSVYGEASTGYYFTKGATKIICEDNDSVAATVNSATVFVYIDADGDTTVYNGYKAAPTFEDVKAVATYTKTTAGSAATLVYVWTDGATMTTTDATLTYLVADSYDRIKEKNGDDTLDYYTVRTLGGATVKVAATAIGTLNANAAQGVLVATKLTYGTDGLVTGITEKSDAKIAEGGLYSTDVVKEDKGVIYIAGTGYSYADDAVVWVIDLVNNTETKMDMDDVNEKAGTYGAWTKIINDNNEVTTLILKKGGAATTVAQIDGVCYTSLQAALDAATNGDTIELVANATLAGMKWGDAGNDFDYASNVTIDGNGYTVTPAASLVGTDAALLFRSVSNITLKDIVFAGWTTTTVVYFMDTTAAVISNCEFKNCDVGTSGTATTNAVVKVAGGSATVEDCTFTGNKGDLVIFAGILVADQAVVKIDNNTFTQNEVTGSAIIFCYNESSASAITNNTVTGNTIDVDGTIDSNNGAPVYLKNTGTVTGNTVTGNTLTVTGGSVGRAAGSIVLKSTATNTGNTFGPNTVVLDGATATNEGEVIFRS